MLSHVSIRVSLRVHPNSSKMGSQSWGTGKRRQKWEGLPAARIRIPSLCREQGKCPFLSSARWDFPGVEFVLRV